MKLNNEQLWKVLRSTRNKLLELTDKTQLADFPLDSKSRGHYREYRQYLRDCPKMFDEVSISSAKVKTFEEWIDWKRSQVY